MPYTHIITHPGSAHKDEFLACALLISRHKVSILRKEPEEADLADPQIAVVDVGGRHEPEMANFDHHQFPADHPPTCSISLVLQHLGVYEDAKAFCDWLEPAEWLDTRGPVATSRWLGISRDTLAKLNSPIDVTLLRRFSTSHEIRPGEPLWEIMAWLGDDLLAYLHNLRNRLDFIAKHCEIWEIPTPEGTFHALHMPRTDPMPEEPSAGLPRYILSHPLADTIAAMVYPDRRGPGYGLSRHQDHPSLDFTRIEHHHDVHFAHARGFVAKTTATEPERLRAFLAEAWRVGG